MKCEQLDEAIDHVAKRLVQVDETHELAARIVGALPARSAWSLYWLLPRLAITTALAGAGALIVLRSFNDGSTEVLRTENARSLIVELARTVTAEAPPTANLEPLLIVRRTIVEPSLNVRGTDEDHAFSLVALAAPDALSLGSMAPEALAAEESLVLPALVLSDLPSIDESHFPR